MPLPHDSRLPFRPGRTAARGAWTALLLLTVATAPAQQVSTSERIDGGVTQTLQSIYIPSIPHAPFTCLLHTEWVQTFADGNTITTRNKRVIARDADGRIFEERRLLTSARSRPGSTEPPETAISYLQFADPILHTLYNCEPRTGFCHLLRYEGDPAAEPEREERGPAGVDQAEPGIERKDLGMARREGEDVHGWQITNTVAAGSLGNSSPLVIRREFWYAEALGINIVSKRDDPRYGRQRFYVTDLKTDPPDPAMFTIPAEYTVVDDRPPAPK